MSVELFDYSQLTNIDRLTIPEGEVAQISYNGSVIWYSSDNFNGYQPVEYIQSDGNQYFDTGVNASNYPDGIKYVFKGNVTEYKSTLNIYWFGALANNSRSANAGSINGNCCVFCGGDGGSYWGAKQPTAGEDFELIVQATSKAANNIIATLNGTQLSKPSSTINSEMPNANIYFLTAKGTGAATTANRKFCGKIYSFTMDSADGTPIRNFVPCYRKSDRVIGLYDTIEDKFYTNIGTGNFTKGNDCLSYYAYQPVEWICAAKDVGAYLNLGFSFDTAAEVYIEQFLDSAPTFTTTSWVYVFGAAENSGKLRCMWSAPANNNGIFVYGSTGSDYASAHLKGGMYAGKNRIKLVLKSGDLHWENLDTGETSVKTTTQVAYTMTSELYLFAQNYNGTVRFNSTAGQSRKIGRFSYYDKNGNLICDLYPCYHKLNGTIGMYDKVRNIFLTNVGTGSFTKGADV